MRNLFDVVGRLRPHSDNTWPRHFSLIDFGTDTVKAVVVRREKAGVRVLGFGFSPTEGHCLSGGRADIAALVAITDSALVAAEDQTETNNQGKVVPDEALFCIPSQFTRGECFSVRQTRADPSAPIAPRELKSVWERVERLARERLPLLDDDSITWKPLAITPGVITVDGHHVTDPVGLKGRDLALSAFGVAAWPSVLRAAETVAERLELGLMSLVATPQSLASVVPQREAILIDIGAQGTSLQLIRHDALVSTSWCPKGGEFFTQSLSWAFRCLPEEAEALKRAYADNALSAKDKDLVARSLVKPIALWLEELVALLCQMVTKQAVCRPTDMALDSDRVGSLPGRIYLTGGGSLLPDLSPALSSLEANPSLGFRRSLEVELLGPKLGTRAPGHLALLDLPPHPVSNLLTPAISLAACLE
jgi:cell division ATPase FtsA